jgi:hypothetical protein
MIISWSLAHGLRELLYNSRMHNMKIWGIKNLPDMYKNCGLTRILVVQELTNLSTENVSVCSQMRKLRSISLLYLPTQVTKPRLKTRYFSLATLPAENIGQTSSNLKLLRSTEWRSLYIQASFPQFSTTCFSGRNFSTTHGKWRPWRCRIHARRYLTRFTVLLFGTSVFPNLGSAEHSATGNTGVISVHCQLPLCFILSVDIILISYFDIWKTKTG